MSSAAGQAALEKIDQVIAGRPHKDDYVLSDATRHMCDYRDEVIAQSKAPGAGAAERQRLEHVNAVVSVVAAAHFPLGKIEWDELSKARDWLADILAQS